MDYICIKLFNNKKRKKYYLYQLLEEKFNYNNDIINFQNMSNEFEIFRSIFLRNDLNYLMTFLSKPSISMAECEKRNLLKEKVDNDNDKNLFSYESKEIDLFKIIEIYPDMLKKARNMNLNLNNSNDNIKSNNNSNNYDFFYASIVEMFAKEIKNLNK
jgi:hypothetical protein